MRIAFLLICYLAACIQMNAQAPKLVMGRVLDKEASEKKRNRSRLIYLLLAT